MKRLLLLISTLVLLVGCGENEYEKDLREAKIRLEEAKEDTKRLEEVSKEIDKTSDSIKEVQEEMGIENELNESEIKELLEYAALGEGDIITDLVIEDEEVKVTIEIADSDIFDDKSLLAETVYSRAGEELLELDDWEVLTIEFVDIGNVSINRSETESNEFGEYFPLEKIIEQLD